jgi:hypothetical protein
VLCLFVEVSDYDVWLSDFERDASEIGLGDFRLYRDSDEPSVVEVFIDVAGRPAARRLIEQQQWRTQFCDSAILSVRVGGLFRRVG